MNNIEHRKKEEKKREEGREKANHHMCFDCLCHKIAVIASI